MNNRAALVAALLLLLAAPAPAFAPVPDFPMPAELLFEKDADAFPSERCGTVDFGPPDKPRAPVNLKSWIEEQAAAEFFVDIPVAVHIVYYTTGRGEMVGEVTDQQIADQIAVLNAAYAGSGVTFHLGSVDRTENRRWAKARPGSGNEIEMKQALSVDPAHTLNLYSTAPGGGLLGWSYFPWSVPEDSYLHGSVIHYATFPGGSYDIYNEGDTATHEIGHYLGLYHTFQGGCTDPNDSCPDTPQEASPDYYCTIGRDSCPLDPGLDPIHNFMDYTPDACMYEFTGDQWARIAWAVTTHKPSLLETTTSGAAAPLVAEVRTAAATGIARVTPNPFQLRSDIHFTLREAGPVSLKVYDLAGREVRALVDRDMPAGAHQAAFDAGDLPSSIYFVVLKSGAELSTTRLLLLK